MDNNFTIIQCDSNNINSYKVKLLQSFTKTLIKHYQDMGFNVLNKEWLFIKID